MGGGALICGSTSGKVEGPYQNLTATKEWGGRARRESKKKGAKALDFRV